MQCSSFTTISFHLTAIQMSSYATSKSHLEIQQLKLTLLVCFPFSRLTKISFMFPELCLQKKHALSSIWNTAQHHTLRVQISLPRQLSWSPMQYPNHYNYLHHCFLFPNSFIWLLCFRISNQSGYVWASVMEDLTLTIIQHY